MSYPDINDHASEEDLKDILSRKELYALKADPERNFRDPPEHDDLAGKYLKIHSHQLFVRNLMNPNTPNKRMHLGHACHPAHTGVITRVGVKHVEALVVGDILIGPDSQEKIITRLYRGREAIYTVHTELAGSFKCNASHIITIILDNVVDIRVTDFLARPRAERRRARMVVSSVNYAGDVAPARLEAARAAGVAYTRDCAIADDYMRAPRQIRQEFIAGVLSLGAHMRTKEAAASCANLCRSLGVCSYIRDNTLLFTPRAMAALTRAHECISVTRFTIQAGPVDDYYGFSLAGGAHYLLDNYIVTHNTGTGKTLAAVVIAQEFIKIYSKMYAALVARFPMARKNYVELDRCAPTVFVLGFGPTKTAFVRELLKYPEFGFISALEREDLLKRQKAAESGLPDDVKNLKDYHTYLKKRITNKSKNGFYKFYGYDEFVNRLFTSDKITLTELDTIVIARLRADPTAATTLEDVFTEYIKNGSIQVNQQLLGMFTESLVICDEIHNTYNMNTKNNRGVALQYILDTVPSVRLVTLSATPINNSPTEVVEVINYLVPKDKKVTKRGLFTNARTLRPGSLEMIGQLTRGKISFLQDVNPKYFPKRIFEGEPYTFPVDVGDFRAGSSLPYIKFILCPMSQLHQNTYSEHLRAHADAATTASIDEAEVGEHELAAPSDQIEGAMAAGIIQYPYHSIPTDGYSIYDMVFPNPESETIGLFRSAETKSKISMATTEWRDRTQVMLKKFSTTNSIITGGFLSREHIGKYSTKYERLLQLIDKIILSAGNNDTQTQKIMIYHSWVKMSGVLLIQELLRANGIIDEFSEPVDSTICCICGVSSASHTSGAEATHTYRPARFVVAHSDIDKTIRDRSLAKYNAPDNARGHNYMILIGSKLIKESFDFKDIQNLIIVAMPTNIPTMVQVFGRCIRKGSHERLPPEFWRVHIYTLVSVVNDKYPAPDPISPEIYKYVDKISDYTVIQEIERELYRNAIDADIHRDIIMPPELRAEYFPQGSRDPVKLLGGLYFEPSIRMPVVDHARLSTFIAYRYSEEEVNTINYLIKRLFLRTSVWTYADLWANVRAPPIGVETNPKMFLEGNFAIALSRLVSHSTPIIAASGKHTELTETGAIERIFNSNERFIYRAGIKHKVLQVEKYYVMFPVSSPPSSILNNISIEHTEQVRDKERAMMRTYIETKDHIVADIDAFARTSEQTPPILVNVLTFLKESRANVTYTSTRDKLLKSPPRDITNFLVNYSARFQMLFLEDAIINAIARTDAGPLSQLYAQVIELFDKFNVLVYRTEIVRYKDVAKQYKNGLPDVLDDVPIGYVGARSVRVWDPAAARWIEVSKISLNRHVTYRENDVIVGFLETTEEGMRFKLRRPAHKIKEEFIADVVKRRKTKSDVDENLARTVRGDTRTIERGIVCYTKNKHDLLKIIAALGVSVKTLSHDDIRVVGLCDIIRAELIKNEIAERAEDSRLKYLYSWWDESPRLGYAI